MTGTLLSQESHTKMNIVKLIVRSPFTHYSVIFVIPFLICLLYVLLVLKFFLYHFTMIKDDHKARP